MAATNLPYYLDDESSGSQLDIDLLTAKDIHITTCTAVRAQFVSDILAIPSCNTTPHTTTLARISDSVLLHDNGYHMIDLTHVLTTLKTNIHSPSLPLPFQRVSSSTSISTSASVSPDPHLTHTISSSLSPPLSSVSIPPVPWVLDICLDYFSTLNPFLPDLISSLKFDFTLLPIKINNAGEIDKDTADRAINTAVDTAVKQIIDCIKNMSFRKNTIIENTDIENTEIGHVFKNCFATVEKETIIGNTINSPLKRKGENGEEVKNKNNIEKRERKKRTRHTDGEREKQEGEKQEGEKQEGEKQEGEKQEGEKQEGEKQEGEKQIGRAHV